MRAVADFDDKIPESNGNNNERTSPMIPAIARTWDAEGLTATLIGGQAVTAEDGKANLGLFFRFAHLDVGAGIFFYRVTGSVNENATYELAPCSGQAADSVGHSPWGGDSFFGVSFGLDKYLGVVKASANKITVPITCEGHTSEVPVNMLDLRIGSGAPVGMYPYSTQIRDVAETTWPRAAPRSTRLAAEGRRPVTGAKRTTPQTPAEAAESSAGSSMHNSLRGPSSRGCGALCSQ